MSRDVPELKLYVRPDGLDGVRIPVETGHVGLFTAAEPAITYRDDAIHNYTVLRDEAVKTGLGGITLIGSTGSLLLVHGPGEKLLLFIKEKAWGGFIIGVVGRYRLVDDQQGAPVSPIRMDPASLTEAARHILPGWEYLGWYDRDMSYVQYRDAQHKKATAEAGS